MPGTVIGTQMGLGYPGTYSRNAGGLVVASRPVKSTDTNNINFGDAVFLNKDSTGGTFSSGAQIAAAITFAAFAGFAVREVLTNVASYSPQPTLGAYLPGMPCDAIEIGNVVVNIQNPSAAAVQAGGSVFIRKAAGTGTVIGAIEPAADGANTVQLTNCMFTTGLVSTDANGNLVAEITILTRNNP